MNPLLIDAILSLTAQGLRLIASLRNNQGLNKLASELEAVAADVDAFRTDPVMKSEMDKLLHSHTWGPPQT